MKKTNTFIKEQTASSDPGLNKTVKSGCIYGFNNEANFISYDNSPQPTASHWLGRGMALAIAKDNYVSIDVKQTDRTCARGCVCIRCERACVCVHVSIRMCQCQPCASARFSVSKTIYAHSHPWV